MSTKIVVRNQMRQGLPILLRNPLGKMVSRIIPKRGTLVIEEDEMSQDVLDKETKKFVKLDRLEG